MQAPGAQLGADQVFISEHCRFGLVPLAVPVSLCHPIRPRSTMSWMWRSRGLWAGRRRPVADGAAVRPAPHRWARRRRRRPPPRTRSLPRPAQAGPALGPHRRRDPRSAHACDLARVGVHGKVELAPGSARPAMLLGIPLALPEQLQAGAVQHQMNRAGAGPDTRLPACERPAAAARRAVVRDGQSQPEQAQHAAAERLGLPKG
jgi:hypothetical protein